MNYEFEKGPPKTVEEVERENAEAQAATLAEEYRAGVGAAIGLESVDMAATCNELEAQAATLAEEFAPSVDYAELERRAIANLKPDWRERLEREKRTGKYVPIFERDEAALTIPAKAFEKLDTRQMLADMRAAADKIPSYRRPPLLPASAPFGEWVTVEAPRASEARFADAVRSFEIREPLKSLLEPEIELLDLGSFLSYEARYLLRIRLHTPHRDTGAEGPLETRLRVPEHLLAAGDEKLIHLWIRSKLKAFLTHELDESIHVRGERVFDPHDPLKKNGDAL